MQGNFKDRRELYQSPPFSGSDFINFNYQSRRSWCISWIINFFNGKKLQSNESFILFLVSNEIQLCVHEHMQTRRGTHTHIHTHNYESFKTKLDQIHFFVELNSSSIYNNLFHAVTNQILISCDNHCGGRLFWF